MIASMCIHGAIRTKKNSGRIVRAGKRTVLLPSEAYRRWEASAVPQMRIAWAGRAPIDYPVNIRATFYRDADRGDAVNYYEALADALETAGVLANDVHVRSWDGTRLSKDKERPRVEIELTEVDE